TLAIDDYAGEAVIDRVIDAYVFAATDPYRAATHNKGIMNGIDPVVVATGNDWRAVEAGAHAYASRSGRYTSLTTWEKAATAMLRACSAMWPRWIPSLASARNAPRFCARPT
ncbi:hypothetical protein QM306_41775, partial [Burkholderia cenocepacia]|nr:hypothetical protein [Burkholderia cenocepacia]